MLSDLIQTHIFCCCKSCQSFGNFLDFATCTSTRDSHLAQYGLRSTLRPCVQSLSLSLSLSTDSVYKYGNMNWTLFVFFFFKSSYQCYYSCFAYFFQRVTVFLLCLKWIYHVIIHVLCFEMMMNGIKILSYFSSFSMISHCVKMLRIAVSTC